MIVNRKRKRGFQTYKIKGKNEYELHLFKPGHFPVNIPLEHGGKLATNIGSHYGTGEKILRYEVSFAKLPDNIKKQVVEAIDCIEKNGTPMENDESIFSC